LKRREFVTHAVSAAAAGLSPAPLPALAPAKGSGSKATKLGGNLVGSSYWGTVRYFINMIHDSGTREWYGSQDGAPGWQFNLSPYIDERGWITGLPPGAWAHFKAIIGGMDRQYGYCKPGKYIARYTGGGTLSLINGGNVSRVRQVKAGRVTFNVDTASPATTNFTFRITNNTGSKINVHNGDVLVCRAELEAAFDAGEVFDPDFKAFIAGYRTLRFMDALGTVYCVHRLASAVPTPANFLSGPWPFEYAGRLCSEIGATLWLNLPTPVNPYLRYTADAATDTLTVHAYDGKNSVRLPKEWVEGDQVFFTPEQAAEVPMFKGQDSGPYYLRDVTANTFRLAATPGGAAMDITTSITLATPKFWNFVCTRYYDPLPLWDSIIARLHAAYPGLNIKLEGAGNEPWNWADPFRPNWMWHNTVGSYLATGSRSGGQFGQSVAWSCLNAWKILEKYYPRAQVERIYPGQAAHVGATSPGLAYVDPGILSKGVTTASLADTVCITGYIGVASTKTSNGRYLDYKWSELIAAHAEQWTTAQWWPALMRSTVSVRTWYEDWRKALDAIRPGIRLTTYEASVGWLEEPVNARRTTNDIYAQICNSFLTAVFKTPGAPGLVKWAQDFNDLGIEECNYFAVCTYWWISEVAVQNVLGIAPNVYTDNEMNRFLHASFVHT
jgi:hypothetical protein